MYTPLVTVPTGGATVQFTATLLVPLTTAAKLADCPPVSETVEGDTEMDTVEGGGVKETVAEAALVESVALVAVTVTVVCNVTVLGV